jgi:single-stranded DNA-specific DHH superfamily exonuclease
MKMSIRGNDFPVLPVLKKVLPQIHGYGGGHAMACGAGIKKEDFDQFIELFKKEVSASSK